ncbi:MAG: acyl-CoA dehydrogenase family protein [Acidobacteriaceae bacterium]|jgi:alkylation response protein AidB-like acyl-CoA dehydrogenase|nr:acyl-CoA dehydrogenase family protein [Acidobacteriaceae bacterium]
MTNTDTRLLRGGEWLLASSTPAAIFTPEQLTPEHRLIGDTVAAFVKEQVLPNLDALEAKDWALSRTLISRCGELGLIGVDVPEEYDGLQLDKTTSMIVSEQMASAASFGPTFGAQTNLAVLPLVLFGTTEQKQRYLPSLVSGTLVGAYCLSESGSGSDALGARARAIRQPDGSFVLSGEKMWITNGGFADLYIVFAKVDANPGSTSGPLFSAFIVERAFPGVSSGAEEHKMGLHGSSTTPVILQDVRVPAANLLGEVGKGHKIAFNVLNFARFKLGAMCVGGARHAIGEAARYARERHQFGQPIASFGAIKHKLGEMVARTYAAESLTYRTIGQIDARVAGATGDAEAAAALAAFEEYAVEASIAKVAGSETLDFVLDENIQIHGGNGFVRDYPAERHYRDARVNRIFEGTNEINRLLIPGMLARRAMKGDIAIIAAAKALQDELLGGGNAPSPIDDPLEESARVVTALKKTSLLVLGLAMQTYRERLTDEQEVLIHLADMLIDTYAADSAVLRAQAAGARQPLHAIAARVFVNDAAQRVEIAARQALATISEGDLLRTSLAALKRLLRHTPVNATALRRELADAAVAKGGWPL